MEFGNVARRRISRGLAAGVALATCLASSPLWAQEESTEATPDLIGLLQDGGVIGIVIGVLSLAVVALICEHIITIRRGAIVPRGLAEEVHQLLSRGQVREAEERCRGNSSVLSQILQAGLAEVSIGYEVVEKSMEDAAAHQAARLSRKIEYLSLAGTLAPMLGLMGTVWGMIVAFMEFESKANPQVAELAPGIYKALVTTLMGLVVAIPALAAFGIFRNRIDQFVAESALVAEQVFVDFKRALFARQRAERRGRSPEAAAAPDVVRKERPA